MSRIVTAGGEQFTIDPQDFTIDMSNITPDLCTTGAKMLDYGALEARLRTEVSSKEAQVEKIKADLDASIRAEAISSGEKLTEKKIEYKIVGSEQYQSSILSLRESKENYNVMRWAMTALTKKTDCLISLSYRERQLMKADTF
jgi:multidrug resistance efflux pump